MLQIEMNHAPRMSGYQVEFNDLEMAKRLYRMLGCGLTYARCIEILGENVQRAHYFHRMITACTADISA